MRVLAGSAALPRLSRLPRLPLGVPIFKGVPLGFGVPDRAVEKRASFVLRLVGSAREVL